MFYHKGVYVANERSHDILNEATMRNIIQKVVFNKIMYEISIHPQIYV